ncbi:MAG: archaellin/type IV pilin N-terminal domain-containing protein [Candidatus Pacearchaeota archaeon]|jgi:flagellin-like protein
MFNNKKALSEMVGYVILIVIAVSLAVMVYAWLQLQLPKEKPECSENVAVIIKDFSCNTENKLINLTIQNKGYFNIEGINLRVANVSGGVTAHPLKNAGTSGAVAIDKEGYIYFEPPMPPGFEYTELYNYSIPGKITSVQIIPFVYEKKIGSTKKQIVLCTDSKFIQEIVCN